MRPTDQISMTAEEEEEGEIRALVPRDMSLIGNQGDQFSEDEALIIMVRREEMI